MAGPSLRSWQRNSVGRLLVTVVLDPPTVNKHVGECRRLSDLTRRLIQRTTDLRLPVTWGMANPAYAPATPVIVEFGSTNDVPHEVAVLADADWMSAHAGRQVFAKELATRVQQAREKGVATTALLKRNTVIGDLLDLVVKFGITATADISASTTKRPVTGAPHCLHYGVWEVPCTGRLPDRFPWYSRDRMLGRIRRVAHTSGLFHLIVDAPALALQGPGGEKRFTRILAQVAELQTRGVLHIETLAMAVARLSHVPAVTPQRSILRTAA